MTPLIQLQGGNYYAGKPLTDSPLEFSPCAIWPS